MNKASKQLLVAILMQLTKFEVSASSWLLYLELDPCPDVSLEFRLIWNSEFGLL